MAHARQPLSPCLRERGQIIFQSVIPFPLLATTSSLPFFFFFFFFFSSPLPVPFSVPDHRTTRTRYRGSFALRRVESERREWDESLLLLVFGSWFIFFSLSSFFSFFRSLFLYGARITRGKLNFCNVRTSGGVRNSSFERSIDIGFRFVVVASILGATRFRPCTSCTLRED